MRSAIGLLLLIFPLQAEIAAVSIVASHRQAVISYRAPTTAACNVTVYSDSARTDPVNDTDTSLFGPAATLDSRAGSVTSGRQRAFVAGQIPIPGWPNYTTAETTSAPVNITAIARASNEATLDTTAAHNLRVNDHVTIAGVTDGTFNATDVLVTAVTDADTFKYASAGDDGSSSSGTVTRVNRYSRALQAETQHWFTIACGGDTYNGTFWTRNLPLGSAYGEVMAFDWSSAPMKSLFPAMPDERGYNVVDPLTGVLARRAVVRGDCTSCSAADYPVSFAAGSVQSCPGTKTNGGYHCLQRTQNGGNRMYWYGPDGESRYLGNLSVPAGAEWSSFYLNWQGMFDLDDPNALYTMQLNTAMGANKFGLLKVSYDGGAYGLDGEVPGNTRVQWGTTVNLTPSAAGKSVTDLIHDFDSTFNGNTYRACELGSVQGNYLTGMCRSYMQNSPGWYFVIDLGDRLPLGSCVDCLAVIAAAPLYANATTRWCGSHYGNFINGNAIEMVGQALNGAGATGPWEVTLTMAGGVDANTTTLTLSGEPVCNAANRPYDGSTYLQDAAVGDVFQFEDAAEYVQITQKNSPTEWVVTRGYSGSTKRTHAENAKLKAICACVTLSLSPDIFWAFLDDPHGTDTTNTYWINDQYMNNVHRTEREPWDVAEGWQARYGSFPDNFRSPVTLTIDPSVRFSGVWTASPGNSYAKHPAYENWREWSNQWGSWFTDFHPFGVEPIPDEYTGKVGGTTYIYRNIGNNTRVRYPKIAPYIGISGTNVLLDKSGPGDCAAAPGGDHCLQDNVSDNYTFCGAYKANECWTGSQPGEFYYNVPTTSTIWAAANGTTASGDLSSAGAGKVVTLTPCPGIAVTVGHKALISGGTGTWEFAPITASTCSINGPSGTITVTTTNAHADAWTISGTRGCSGGEIYGNATDLCAMHTNTYGQGVLQLGLTKPFHQGPDYSRTLIRGLFSPWRGGSGNSSANTTPDGRWLLFPTTAHSMGTLAEEAHFLAKVPSYPPVDNVNRTTFVPLPVKLGGIAGATKTVLDFGYDPEQTWRCTQRDEACVVVASTFTDANPYALAKSDNVSGGVDCSAGCTINIPAISGRVVYYRWRYRDDAGNVLGTSAAQVIVAP